MALTNTDFELDPAASGSYFFRENRASGETGIAAGTWATDQKRSGTRSLKIYNPYTISTSYSRWLSNNTAIPAVAGATYNASVWIRTSGAGVGARFRLTYWNGAPGTPGLASIGETNSSMVTGTTSAFVQRTLTGTAPQGTIYIRVEFMLFGAGTAWFDDVVFQGQAVGTITVTSPNGGESWKVGSSHNITWTSSGVNNVNIDLMQNGVLLSSIASNVPNTGTYSWFIPDQPSISNLAVRVSDSLNPSVSDTSNATFSLIRAFITVLYPNGPTDKFKAGSIAQLSWLSSAVSNVKIELVKGADVVNVIEASVPNIETYSWQIPSNQTPGADYKIRISDDIDNTIKDESNGYFVISPDPLLTSISVLSPNGGESWQAGGLAQTIQWSWTGDPGPVNIELMKGLVPNPVAMNIPNTGSFSWSISSSQEPGNYRIRVSSALDILINDSSDSDFEIINPCPTPESAFTYTKNNLQITFTDISSVPAGGDPASSWNWDFGDGQGSSEQNPVHVYSAAGPYTVFMIASNSCGLGQLAMELVEVTTTPAPQQAAVQKSNTPLLVLGAVGSVAAFKILTAKKKKKRRR